MVMEPKVFDYIEGDSTVFEKALWKTWRGIVDGLPP